MHTEATEDRLWYNWRRCSDNEACIGYLRRLVWAQRYKRRLESSHDEGAWAFALRVRRQRYCRLMLCEI